MVKRVMEFGIRKITIECQAVIFDLDGTLIDSVEAIRRIWQAWGNQHKIADPNLLEIATSTRTVEAVRLLAPHLNIAQETEYLELAEATELDGVVIVEGAKELILSLPRQSWSIVTSITRRTALAKLNHVNLPIPAVLVTADDVSRGKPAPDGYLLAAERLGVEANQCVVVEDTLRGVQAACAAGMMVIGLATTHSVKQIKQASMIVSSLRNIKVNDRLDNGYEHIDFNQQLIRLQIEFS